MKIAENENRVILESVPKGRIFELSAGSHLTYLLLADKPWESKPCLQFVLNGEAARLDLIALILGKGEGAYDLKTETVHSAKHTVSGMKFKAAMYDATTTDIEGMTIIEKNADFSDAHMDHRALLMSPRAKSNVLPSMEISAHEVKAGHSSGTGKPDKDSLFYLMSRGIPEARANSLLVESFFKELADAVPPGAEKEIMIKWLQKFSYD